MGAHVIKVGLAPILVDLLERGLVSAVATNGAGALHDFELAYAGVTSEDVEAQMAEGDFGMAEETGRVLNEGVAEGVRRGLGFGRALGERLLAMHPPHLGQSLFAACARLAGWFGPCTSTSIGVGEPKLITWLMMSPASKERATSGNSLWSAWRSRSLSSSPRNGAPGFNWKRSTASCCPLVNR